MAYLHIATGAYPLTAADIRAQLRDVSFPADVAGFEAALPAFGYAVVASTTPPAADHTQVLQEESPRLVDGTYRQAWRLDPAGAALVAERTALEAQRQRQQRDALLAASDWTQVPDAINAGANQDAWAAYRQRLRDISDQPGFPWTVAWPAAPALLPPAAEVNYRLFYDALLVSPAYGAIRQRAVNNPAVLTACVEFIAAIGDAKAGRPNEAAIQACVDLLCAAAQFTEPELMALAEVMTYGGLSQLYTLPAS